jgi:hypothetical protein
MWHFSEIEGGSAVLTICGVGRRGSRFGWEAEMNDDRQSSFGGHGVGGGSSLGAFYKSDSSQKRVQRGCA